MTSRSTRARRPLRRYVAIVLVLAVIGGSLGVLAIATDTLGAGQRWDSLVARVDRFLAGPVPDRQTVDTVEVTDPGDEGIEPEEEDPDAGSLAPNEPSAVPTPTSAATPIPDPTPTPQVPREPVDVDIVTKPKQVFASQAHKDWCAPAGVQMALAVMGLVDTSEKTQREIHGKVRTWESYEDSHNGDWGPGAMVLALDAYGAPGYEIHAFKTRQGALRGAAKAIEATGAPVILLAWRGAHTWVMTGFRADADPAVFKDAHISGTYILDPWYPRISTIWGPSDPPGTFQDESEMERNFLKWRRPEGRYPDRDGKYIVLIPTVKVSEG
ncbi:MAG TPA: hypothetical protein VIH00_03835 [Candidatus Limnocylindrales bacterium]